MVNLVALQQRLGRLDDGGAQGVLVALVLELAPRFVVGGKLLEVLGAKGR
jgi:hypothetical protein